MLHDIVLDALYRVGVSLECRQQDPIPALAISLNATCWDRVEFVEAGVENRWRTWTGVVLGLWNFRLNETASTPELHGQVNDVTLSCLRMLQIPSEYGSS